MQQVPDIPNVPLEGLYGEVIMDHYRNPRNHHPVSDADLVAEEVNPFCGDEVSVQLRLDATGRVAQVGFHGQGCSISQASASMMTEAMEDKTLEELEGLSRVFLSMMRGKRPSDTEMEELGALTALQAVRKIPVRIKCALLAWSALEQGIQDFRSRNGAKG